ncbi:hypothetical protein M0R45_009269 [Rubus argutus]|uniref:Uncharacterized protein n=1 Tax=Rubus argutus TaxID=59490 RepID=A0AAW1Y4G0_RUBAR
MKFRSTAHQPVHPIPSCCCTSRRPHGIITASRPQSPDITSIPNQSPCPLPPYRHPQSPTPPPALTHTALPSLLRSIDSTPSSRASTKAKLLSTTSVDPRYPDPSITAAVLCLHRQQLKPQHLLAGVPPSLSSAQAG